MREAAAAAQQPAVKRSAAAKVRFLESEAAEAASWAEEAKTRLFDSTSVQGEQDRSAAAKAKMDAAAQAWQQAKMAAEAAAAEAASAAHA